MSEVLEAQERAANIVAQIEATAQKPANPDRDERLINLCERLAEARKMERAHGTPMKDGSKVQI
ncbi:hypothetical protein [Marinobacter shengliensis]|uniref:hypothetical protein n=1 Tax=Marinobacter shengliensis TaxID=1389223 RepID=UPI00110819AB|nr:hypothetical protein [Marinobacter shengliensis]